jgi:signal transduction histidine kinase
MSKSPAPVNQEVAPNLGAADLAALGQASAKLVHDFKNQLGGLKLYATFLKTRLADDADAAEIVDKIVQGLDSMAENATLVTRLARPLELRCEAGDLVALVHKVVAALTAQGAARQVVLLAEGAEALPPIRFDWQHLQIALEAVIRRALVLAPAQSKVRVGLELRDATVTLWVSEESQRLSEAARQQFFDWTAQERLQKTALEMALAARIVKAHGGEARVRQAGNLTLVEFIFKVELPPQEQHA